MKTFWVVTQLFLILWSKIVLAEMARYDGPNCINNALVESGIIPFHRYSSLTEINLIIRSNLCQKLALEDNNSKAIGLVYSENIFADKSIISHAFIRLNDQIAQEKHGWSKTEAYQVTDLESIFKDYDLLNPKTSVHYYRCQTWNEYLNSVTVTKKMKQNLMDLKFIEMKLNKIMEKNEIDQKELKEISNDIYLLSKNIVTPESESEKFILKVIASRIVSIANQLNILGEPNLHKITYQWEYKLESIEVLFQKIIN